MSHLSRAELASESQRCDASLYSLETMNYSQEYDDRQDDRSPLLAPETPRYGATFPRSPTVPSSGRIIFNATLKMACIFAVSTLFLGGTLWLALPTLEPYVLVPFPLQTSHHGLAISADRQFLQIPKSFQQLQDLNGLLKKYRDIYPYRIVVCYVSTYLLSVPLFPFVLATF